jgi:tRNA A58 N-methylase Trm61
MKVQRLTTLTYSKKDVFKKSNIDTRRNINPNKIHSNKGVEKHISTPISFKTYDVFKRGNQCL